MNATQENIVSRSRVVARASYRNQEHLETHSHHQTKGNTMNAKSKTTNESSHLVATLVIVLAMSFVGQAQTADYWGTPDADSNSNDILDQSGPGLVGDNSNAIQTGYRDTSNQDELGLVGDNSNAIQYVQFNDSNLKAAVMKKLDLVTFNITSEQMLALWSLKIYGDYEIKDLTGLQHAQNLQTLTIRNNKVRDLAPLAGLTNLKYLDLGGNQIIDIWNLDELTKLVELDLAENAIIDIGGLRFLKNLVVLELDENSIWYIGGLSKLTKLEELHLNGNSISDISVLPELVYLDHLDLSGNKISGIDILLQLPFLSRVNVKANPLDYWGSCDVIIQLSVNGVYVDWDWDQCGPNIRTNSAQKLTRRFYPDTSEDVDTHHVHTLYVDDDAPADPGTQDPSISDPEEDGTRAHPYDSIQEAINVADDGQTVVVLSGTYFETIDFMGKGIQVTGIDPDAPGAEDQSRPVIDGFYQGTVVTFAQGEDPNAQLSGFTITRGLGELAGGILCAESHPVISNCLIVGNQALSSSGGGGVYCANSDAVFDNCTISGNRAGLTGAGFYSDGGVPLVMNSIVWDSTPADVGFPLYAEPIAPTFFYSNLGVDVIGQGNISIDPQFVRPGSWALLADADQIADTIDPEVLWIEGDYHLSAESSCVNAGDPEYLAAANQTDHDGDPRIVYERIDMGSDEFVAEESPFFATYGDVVVKLFEDFTSEKPTQTYVGQTTVRLNTVVEIELVGQATTAVGGTWTVRTEPEIVGPGTGIEVVLYVTVTDMDMSLLLTEQGNLPLAGIEVGGIPVRQAAVAF